jgi:hypothetical protein
MAEDKELPGVIRRKSASQVIAILPLREVFGEDVGESPIPAAVAGRRETSSQACSNAINPNSASLKGA